ncbi:MAG: type II toxin-antitoxin system CcdA family antitoxin [Terriglobales bacterium]
MAKRRLQGKRRTTLSLPADALGTAARLARARNVNLSTVVSEALAEGLRVQTAAEKSGEIWERYRRAFAGFSEEEVAILDGVIPESSEPAR